MSLDPIKKQQTQQLESTSVGDASSKSEIDIDAEYVPLPSKGIAYSGVYQGMSELKVRQLGFADEDILTTKSYYDNGTLFDEILKNCIVDPNGFKAEMLIDVDKNAILWWLRIGAFGRDYTVNYICPNEECKHKHQVTWDLASFETPDVNPTYHQELLATNGAVKITLPISGLKCLIAIPNIAKEREVLKRLKNRKEKSKSTSDFAITGRLLSVIKEAYSLDETKTYKGYDGIQDWLRTANNGNPITIADSRYIQKIAKEINLKIDTKKDIQCPSCGHTEEGVELITSITFFWPDAE